MKQNRYGKLFLNMLQLSTFTFGGGFVMIPLMQKKFVDELHWIDETEMMDLTAIAQSSPGAIVVNISILVGYHVAGLMGAFFTVLGSVLPPIVIISVISFFYQAFRDNVIVSLAMAGMLAGVAAVLCDVVITMGREVIKERRILPIAMMMLAFAATCFFHVNIMLILLCCAGVGAIDTIFMEKKRKKSNRL